MQDGCILCWLPWYAFSESFLFREFLVHQLVYFSCKYCLLIAETVPVRTVNRQCSSGLQAVADVAAAIRAGFYDIGNN